MDAPQGPDKRSAPFERRRAAEHELIDEITDTARKIGAARDWSGEPVFRADGIWRVLTTVESSRYCLAIADLARALGVRRQVAHELAHAAARAGFIELASNSQDKRILQCAAGARRPARARRRSDRPDRLVDNVAARPWRSRACGDDARRQSHPPAARARCARVGAAQSAPLGGGYGFINPYPLHRAKLWR